MSILWDIIGVLAVAAALILALLVPAVIAGVEDERWWRERERDR